MTKGWRGKDEINKKQMGRKKDKSQKKNEIKKRWDKDWGGRGDKRLKKRDKSQKKNMKKCKITFRSHLGFSHYCTHSHFLLSAFWEFWNFDKSVCFTFVALKPAGGATRQRIQRSTPSAQYKLEGVQIKTPHKITLQIRIYLFTYISVASTKYNPENNL